MRKGVFYYLLLCRMGCYCGYLGHAADLHCEDTIIMAIAIAISENACLKWLVHRLLSLLPLLPMKNPIAHCIEQVAYSWGSPFHSNKSVNQQSNEVVLPACLSSNNDKKYIQEDFLFAGLEINDFRDENFLNGLTLRCFIFEIAKTYLNNPRPLCSQLQRILSQSINP